MRSSSIISSEAPSICSEFQGGIGDFNLNASFPAPFGQMPALPALFGPNSWCWLYLAAHFLFLLNPVLPPSHSIFLSSPLFLAPIILLQWFMRSSQNEKLAAKHLSHPSSLYMYRNAPSRGPKGEKIKELATETRKGTPHNQPRECQAEYQVKPLSSENIHISRTLSFSCFFHLLVCFEMSLPSSGSFPFYLIFNSEFCFQKGSLPDTPPI